MSVTDVENDPEFEFAPILTPTNVERASVNKNAVIRFAQKHGLPVLFWVNQYGNVPAAVRNRCPNELTIMSEKYFVVGAPCMITKNFQPVTITGVVNGSRGVLHSLSWTSRYQVPSSGWKPGEIIEVPVPRYVNVSLDEKTHDNGGIFPCAINSSHIRVGGANLNMRQHPVTLLFVVTPFKVQGQTTPRLILDLRHKKGKALTNLSFEDVYVAMTRIASAEHLRIITSSDDQTDHITRLKRSTHFSRWMKCYTPDGNFDGRILRGLGREEYSQSLKTVQTWTIKDFKKQKRITLLKLTRKLRLRVKRSGRGDQPIKEDAWNVLLPIWKVTNPNSSLGEPRQSVRKKIGDISMCITPEKRGCDHAVTSFKTPVIARHPIREKSKVG